MVRSLLVSALFLVACGGAPPVVEAPDPPDGGPEVVGLVADDTTGDGDPGGAYDRCAEADCNDRDTRAEYTDPADQRIGKPGLEGHSK